MSGYKYADGTQKWNMIFQGHDCSLPSVSFLHALQRHRSQQAHPSAEMAAHAKCPPFSLFGSTRNTTRGCSSASSANFSGRFGIFHTSTLRLPITSTKRGAAARNATGTGGRGSTACGPCKSGRTGQKGSQAFVYPDGLALWGL